LFSKVKWLRQHTVAKYIAQIAHHALDQVHRDIGVFNAIVPDNTEEMVEEGNSKG
jgi:hypothetical protein